MVVFKTNLQGNNSSGQYWSCIGVNCMKELEPMDIISSKNGGPYACRTKVDWCIVAPITTSRSERSVKCHRIAVKDVASGKMAPHHFLIDDKSKIEDVGIKEMRMYFSDFCEVNHLPVNIILDNTEDISREDNFFWIFWKQAQRTMRHIMKYLYHSEILMFNSLTTEAKLLKECII